MPAALRRVLRHLRLALVCLTLVWSSAPASAAPITDAIVLVAAAHAPPAEAAAPRPRVRVERAPESVAPIAEGTYSVGPVREARDPRPARRIYIEQRALLC
ncbi:MAG: hypothetical protein QM820_57530 [Minicystis sp.]